MPTLLRSQSAVIHLSTEFLNEINKKAVEYGNSQDYIVSTQWCIMGKTTEEIKDLMKMLSILVSFIVDTGKIMEMEIKDRAYYE